MELSELIATTARSIFSRKKAAFENFKVSFEKYLESKNSFAAQLELEECFHKAYKKKASTKLIMKMATLPMGPYEAFDIYSHSSPAIGCDYKNHTIRTPKKKPKGKLVEFAKFVGYMLLISTSLAAFTFGAYIAVEIIKVVFSFSKNDFMQIDFEGVFEIFLMSLFGVISFASGVLTLWGASKLIVYDRTEAAITMAEAINNHDYSS